METINIVDRRIIRGWILANTAFLLLESTVYSSYKAKQNVKINNGSFRICLTY